MGIDKKLFVNRIQDGQAIEDVFLVRQMSRAETRSGKPYLILTLMDRTGEIGARLWDNADTFLELCQPGSLVLVIAQAQDYKGSLQLKVDAVRQVDKGGVDFTLFMQTSKNDRHVMARELESLAGSINNSSCRKLLRKFFNDTEFFEQFKTAPAAKSMHHAYLGGLLEHTLAVARLADMLAGFYPALDRDLLMTGALLHDVGKIREFAFESYPFDYTDMGRLMGHIVLGAEMIQERISTVTDFPEDLSTRLQHLILSHHGRHEFGSPSVPMLSEAFVLHFIDDLDAKLNFITTLEEQAPEPGYQWTDFQRVLDRFLYVNGRPHGTGEHPGQSGTQDNGERSSVNSKQQQLF